MQAELKSALGALQATQQDYRASQAELLDTLVCMQWACTNMQAELQSTHGTLQVVQLAHAATQVCVMCDVCVCVSVRALAGWLNPVFISLVSEFDGPLGMVCVGSFIPHPPPLPQPHTG